MQQKKSKKIFNRIRIRGNSDSVKIWMDKDMNRLLEDRCPNTNCDGMLVESGFNIVCEKCPFEMYRDDFDEFIARKLGTHGDRDL